MTKLCDRRCTKCQDTRKGVYLCLKSENEFLSSLLRLGLDDGSGKNLLGYAPDELTDWYFYARRAFSNNPNKSQTPFSEGLKILDELGKLLFSITQVTANIPTDGPTSNGHPEECRELLLLQPKEQILVNAFLGESHFDSTREPRIIYEMADNYQDEVKNLKGIARRAETALDDLSTRKEWREKYCDELECRAAYMDIEAIAIFHWREYNTNVYLILRKLFPGEIEENKDALVQLRTARLKFASAYLHGVARFAFGGERTDSTDFGYWIEGNPGFDIKTNHDSHKIPESELSEEQQRYAFIPNPKNQQEIQLSCEMAASFVGEYIKQIKSANIDSIFKTNVDFDILFMCKEESGWFWALTDSQFQFLKHQGWDGSHSIEDTLERFRFKHAGIINHMERAGCLTEEVYDFTQEKLICTAIGYNLEDAGDLSSDFTKFECSLPGVETGSYFYFRISSHKNQDPEIGIGAENAIPNEKFLPEGSLVAILRLERNLEASGKLQYMALVRQLVERWRAKIDSLPTVVRTVRELERPLKNRTTRAAIMSRNLSHNIGSHALANPKLLQNLSRDVDKKTQANLNIFHQYLQNRLDYIARSLNPGTERPEPLFFVNELLNGFFRQAVLLETLLEDQGFGGGNIHFHVRTQTAVQGQKTEDASGNEAWSLYQLSGGNGKQDGANTKLSRFRLTKGQEPPVDTLIGVMGGMIGGQALYSFLENIMRNAAKYGANRAQETFDIHLDLRDANPCETEDHKRYFILEIWENLSSDVPVEGGTVAEVLRGHLDADLIDDKGEPISKGQGIQEMKMAAEFLSGGHLFKSDAESCACPDCQKTGKCKADAYCRYIDNGQKRQNGAQPLRCYAIESAEPMNTGKIDSKNPVVYQLLIPKAILAGVVDTNAGSTQPKTCVGTNNIVGYGSVEKLAGTGAAFGVILDSPELDEARIEERVQEIRKHHNALPFRLMILTDSPERTEKWKSNELIRQMLAGYKTGDEEGNKNPVAFNHKKHLPARRLHIVESARLHEIFTSAVEPDESLLGMKKFLGATGWNAALLMLYHHWLIAFKGVPHDNTWKLVIGFERSQEQVEKRWKAPLDVFDTGEHRKLTTRGVTDQESIDVHAAVEVHVCGRYEDIPWSAFSSKGANSFTTEPIDRQFEGYFPKRQGYVVFDNHGQAVSGLKKRAIHFGVRCIHEFSGKENLSLFQSLESPPQEPFSFAWFLYSLLESALLDVAIIDERVAGAAAGPGILRALNRAGIFPVFNLRDNGNRTPLDPSLEAKLGDSITDGSKEQLQKEGVTLSPPAIDLACQKQNDVEKTVHPPSKNADKSSPIHPLDAVIIHEGVVDVVLRKPVWKKEGLEQNLFALAPRVIRTSGRGSQPRHLLPRLPFMEFSELSETTYRALNKLILSKAVLGVFGPNEAKKEN
uniref:Uncharacterized protein n=1 Tax=Candidatus Kentrum sp. DK TaxID=2126562 RepID=A0A450RWY1_9GAMM|nr:MAG: hypothetical protein BECKDK2373B_GA0170837_100627 [Candidatus Kentron sp. DK]